MGGPRRRVEATFNIGADSIEALVGALRSIGFAIAHEHSRESVCGGYSYGWDYKITEDESITHESWEAQLDAYLIERSQETPDA